MGTKPKLLIIGYARHGKDTVAELIKDKMNLHFESSSVFVGKRCIWPVWGKERYKTFDDMFKDRINNRKIWANLISAYNTPDKCRTAREMITSGCDMYVGMRMRDEFEACKKEEMFDYVIWVDALKRHPKEDFSSNELTSNDADFFIDNNRDISELEQQIKEIQADLHLGGWDVNFNSKASKCKPTESNLTWLDKPEGATSVLDHGFIQVKEVMGSDKAIADSARMSYGRGTKKVNNDEGLIDYLVRNHHTSPLEMGEIKFHMRLPIFVMRQLVRHRTANLNEYSGRYSEMVRLFYTPKNEQICVQDKVNKQGSAEPVSEDIAEWSKKVMENSCNRAFDSYEILLKEGVSRETARIVLPLNTYTECVWKLDISNLIKFLYLRDDSHAQWEIQVYAKEIAKAVKEYFPMVYKAYEKSRDSVKLSKRQIESLMYGYISEDLSKSEANVISKLLDDIYFKE